MMAGEESEEPRVEVVVALETRVEAGDGGGGGDGSPARRDLK